MLVQLILVISLRPINCQPPIPFQPPQPAPPPPPLRFQQPLSPQSPFQFRPPSPFRPVIALPPWNNIDIRALLERISTADINQLPPYVLERLIRFCEDFTMHPGCSYSHRWQWYTPKKIEPTDTKTTLPPIPWIQIPDPLQGVPSALKDEITHAFCKLNESDKQDILKACSGKVKCTEQNENFTKKRLVIARQEVALKKMLQPETSDAEQVVELRHLRTQQVKEAMLRRAGIADQVVAANDGTFQNDILLTEHQSNWILNEINALNGRRKRDSLFLEEAPTQKWQTGKPIKYSFHPSLNSDDQEVVQKALFAIEKSTCIQFEYAAEHPESMFIYYVKNPDPAICGLSFIGRVDPVNQIYLSFMCADSIGVAVHETMHALGINHQQLRADRDEYITVKWDNINPQQYDYFAVADTSQFTSYGVEYDYYSIMHYGPFVGGVDLDKPTLIPKLQPERFIKILGQRKGLSDRDVELLRVMYCNPDCEDKYVYCGMWTLKRLCGMKSHERWMKENCRRSCGFC